MLNKPGVESFQPAGSGLVPSVYDLFWVFLLWVMFNTTTQLENNKGEERSAAANEKHIRLVVLWSEPPTTLRNKRVSMYRIQIYR